MESYVRNKFTDSKAGHDYIFLEQKMKELLKARLEEGDSHVREDLSFVHFLFSLCVCLSFCFCIYLCLSMSILLCVCFFFSLCLSLFIMHSVYIHLFVYQRQDLLQLLIDARADSDDEEEDVKNLPPSKRKLTDVEIERTSFSFLLAGEHNISV